VRTRRGAGYGLPRWANKCLALSSRDRREPRLVEELLAMLRPARLSDAAGCRIRPRRDECAGAIAIRVPGHWNREAGLQKKIHFPVFNCARMRYNRLILAGCPWTRESTEEGSMAKAKKKVAKKPAKKAAKKTAKKKTVKKAKKAKK